MDFEITGQALAICGWTNEDLGKPNGAFAWGFHSEKIQRHQSIANTFNFLKIVLLNDVCHCFLLLLPLIDFFLQLLDGFVERIKAMTVCTAVGDRSDEGGVWIFEWLEDEVSCDPQPDSGCTHRVLLFASKLTRCLEVNSKVSELSFVRLAGIFYDVDVEGNSEPIDR